MRNGIMNYYVKKVLTKKTHKKFVMYKKKFIKFIAIFNLYKNG